jgi:hypothetical protein
MTQRSLLIPLLAPPLEFPHPNRIVPVELYCRVTTREPISLCLGSNAASNAPRRSTSVISFSTFFRNARLRTNRTAERMQPETESYTIENRFSPLSTVFAGRCLTEHDRFCNLLYSTMDSATAHSTLRNNGKLRGLVRLAEERIAAIETFVADHVRIYGDVDQDRVLLFNETVRKLKAAREKALELDKGAPFNQERIRLGSTLLFRSAKAAELNDKLQHGDHSIVKEVVEHSCDPLKRAVQLSPDALGRLASASPNRRSQSREQTALLLSPSPTKRTKVEKEIFVRAAEKPITKNVISGIKPRNLVVPATATVSDHLSGASLQLILLQEERDRNELVTQCGDALMDLHQLYSNLSKVVAVELTNRAVTLRLQNSAMRRVASDPNLTKERRTTSTAGNPQHSKIPLVGLLLTLTVAFVFGTLLGILVVPLFSRQYSTQPL